MLNKIKNGGSKQRTGCSQVQRAKQAKVNNS